MEKTKKSLFKKLFDIDILEQQDYTKNIDVQNSFLHYQHLKENETQYFKIEGSEKILAAKSLFVLRLNYKNSKK